MFHLLGDCFIDGLPVKAVPLRVGFLESLTLNLSSQSQGSMLGLGPILGEEAEAVCLLARVPWAQPGGCPPHPALTHGAASQVFSKSEC